MGDKTNIAWTSATWNPIRGCSRVSEGCRFCYAESVAARFSGPGLAYEGLAKRVGGEPRWTGKVRFVEEHLADPLRWTKPRRIFVNSMSDLFHERLPFEQIAAVFGVMAAAPRHIFQVLTKRPERAKEWFEWVRDEGDEWGSPHFVLRPCASRSLGDGSDASYDSWGDRLWNLAASHGGDGAEMAQPWPLPNVWLGVSAENQETADERIPVLLQIPAAVRWVSAEPLLGPVEMAPWLRRSSRHHLKADVEGMLRNRSFDALCDAGGKPLTAREAENELLALRARGVKYIPAGGCDAFDPQKGCPGHPNPRLDWVVVGGESGRVRRDCEPAWIEGIVEQCRDAGTACFVKQDSGLRSGEQGRLSAETWAVKQWPDEQVAA